MDKQTVGYTYNGILLNHKKKLTADMYYYHVNKNLRNIVLSERSQVKVIYLVE